MQQKQFNNRLRQVLLLVLIIFLGFVLVGQLRAFIPGLLGGITLYIISSKSYNRLVYERNWRKGWTALLYIIIYIIVIAIPVYLTITLVSPKIEALFKNQEQVMASIQKLARNIENLFGIQLLSEENIQKLSQRVSSFIPSIINSTLSIVTNLTMMFFLLYYMLVNGQLVEKIMSRAIPLKEENIHSLAIETRMMIKANAVGIPIICVIQGVFATLGYWMFGVDDWGLWGFITGVFAYFPIVGTMVVWVPLAILSFANGDTYPALGLTIYSIVVTGNVDYVARFSLLKKLGNVHPLVTVLGVIVGLKLFGFVGLIFGPLLISYIMVLVRIYFNEFSSHDIIPEVLKAESVEEAQQNESDEKEVETKPKPGKPPAKTTDEQEKKPARAKNPVTKTHRTKKT